MKCSLALTHINMSSSHVDMIDGAIFMNAISRLSSSQKHSRDIEEGICVDLIFIGIQKADI